VDYVGFMLEDREPIFVFGMMNDFFYKMLK
jgi:hypothetical protein